MQMEIFYLLALGVILDYIIQTTMAQVGHQQILAIILIQDGLKKLARFIGRVVGWVACGVPVEVLYGHRLQGFSAAPVI